ncbi:MAG: TIGR03936 family radical SAM-associated protein [Mycobacteriales bacterium]|nr:TIGR03936 family radical SAM-associated protein [Mycobacteriales bacterium]
MAKKPPGLPQPAPVQRLRLRYAKRGRLRFTSHRDIARAFERALRRADVPMAYSSGFSPHPKVSWVGAAPTGVASEAEYVEIGLARIVDPEALRRALDESLPVGLDVLEAVEAPVGTSLPDRVEASRWAIRLPGLALADVESAVAAFVAAAEVPVERLTKDGVRRFDARGPVVRLVATDPGDGCATLLLVVRHVTPAVRPDDVLSALRAVADLVPPVPPEATRQAQGPLSADGEVGDPLAPDRGHDPAGATRQDADREQTVGGP